VVLTIRSKTHRGAAGRFVPVPRLDNGPCAVAALDAWLAIPEQKKGPLFRSFSRARGRYTRRELLHDPALVAAVEV
jgi:hypothetical protein